MLYVFAGFPKQGLHAGGIQLLVESEELGLLEEDPSIQYLRENVDELGGYRMSENCALDGIGFDWFPENWSFGNGITVHKTSNKYQGDKVISYNNDGSVVWDQVPIDRSEYEARWADGKCPQDDHAVMLTWLVFTHELPAFAYERLRAVIEDGAALEDPALYEVLDEPGKYKSEIRTLKFPKENHVPIPSF